MMSKIFGHGTLFLLILALGLVSLAVPAAGAAEITEVPGFPTVARRAVTFWSDGTRLAGDLTYPKDMPTGAELLRAETKITFKQTGRTVEFVIPSIEDFEVAVLYSAS